MSWDIAPSAAMSFVGDERRHCPRAAAMASLIIRATKRQQSNEPVNGIGTAPADITLCG